MGNKKKYSNAIQSIINIDVTTISESALLKKTDQLLRSGQQPQAFLLATFGLRFLCNGIDYLNNQNEFLLRINQATGCDFDLLFINKMHTSFIHDDETSQSKHERIFDWLKNNTGYKNLVALCVCNLFSLSNQTILLLWELYTETTEKERMFIEQMLVFHSQTTHWHLNTWHVVDRMIDHHVSKGISSTHILTHLFKKLIRCGEKNLILCFYWYYAYLGERNISDVLFSSLLEEFGNEMDFQMPFTKNFTFGQVNLESVEGKYNRITDVMCGKEVNKNVTVHNLLGDNGLSLLIPLCLYSKEKGNIEIESLTLWHAIRKSSSKRLLERMAEISGYELPKDFQGCPLNQRANWLVNRFSDCEKAYRVDDPILYIESVKKLYTIKPFAIEVLKALFKIDSLYDDQDVKNMLQYSIGRIISPVILGRILSYAITTQDPHGVRLVLSQLILLNYYDTIIHSVEMVGKYINAHDVKHNSLIREVLDSYQEFIPKNQIQWERLNHLNAQYARSQKKISVLFTDFQKTEIIEEKEVVEFLNKNEYKKLMGKFKNGTVLSPPVLVMMLKSALKVRNAENVLLVYKELVKKNTALASFFNLDVEPYFLQQRISKETSKIGMSNLVSNVWGRPAVLESPVNKKALRVANYPKGVNSPVKKKLKFD